MARRRRRGFRRSRRGSTGKGGFLGRAFRTVTTRPLKVVAAGLGIGAAASVLLSGSSTGDGNGTIAHIGLAISAAQRNDMPSVGANLNAIPGDILNGAMSGQWIAPAIGAIVTGVISRKFRI